MIACALVGAALVAPGGSAAVPPAFAPALVARAGATATVFVLGSAPCTGGRCVELFRGGAGPRLRAYVSAPPSGRPSSSDVFSTGSVAALVFANQDDGYAIEGPEPSGDGGLLGTATGPVYATTDGGESWRVATWFRAGSARLRDRLVGRRGVIRGPRALPVPSQDNARMSRSHGRAKPLRLSDRGRARRAVPGPASLAVGFVGMAAAGARQGVVHLPAAGAVGATGADRVGRRKSHRSRTTPPRRRARERRDVRADRHLRRVDLGALSHWPGLTWPTRVVASQHGRRPALHAGSGRRQGRVARRSPQSRATPRIASATHAPANCSAPRTAAGALSRSPHSPRARTKE